MQALIVEHPGERGAIRDIAMPQPGPNDILVRVTAASVNPIDWKLIDGDRRALPFVAGQDFAGVVSAVGASVYEYHEGERLFGIARTHGAFAEFTIVPANSTQEPIAHIPDGLGDADAASLPTAGLTALAALDALHVTNRTTLAILGVTGGVGGFAAQIAHARGARVIGSGRSDHANAARENGTDEYIAYDRENVATRVRELVPRGVDAVLDLVDPAGRVGEMMQLMRPGGGIVSTIGALDVRAFVQRGFEATNLVMNETPQSSPEGLRQLARLVLDGSVAVPIDAERDLREAPQLLEISRSGNVTGKLVLTVETGRI